MVERILSGSFCPLTAPLRSSRFSVSSAPFSAPLTLRSHALARSDQWLAKRLCIPRIHNRDWPL